MTHEKLLNKIDPYGMDDYGDFKVQYGKALRAVVELHKPFIHRKESLLKDTCANCFKVYPCDTIQAIEKELQ